HHVALGSQGRQSDPEEGVEGTGTIQAEITHPQSRTGIGITITITKSRIAAAHDGQRVARVVVRIRDIAPDQARIAITIPITEGGIAIGWIAVAQAVGRIAIADELGLGLS